MPLKAVIFDMDGTITRPVIDWQTLRADIGAPPERSIMEHIRSLPGKARRRAEAILLDTELRATDKVSLNDGFHELFDAVRSAGLRTGVVTNNHGAALDLVLEQHRLQFDVALSRDDGELKPAPDLIRLALDRLGVSPEEAIGLGDSRLDVAACRAAGVACVYLTHGSPAFDHDLAAETLWAVGPILDQVTTGHPE